MSVILVLTKPLCASAYMCSTKAMQLKKMHKTSFQRLSISLPQANIQYIFVLIIRLLSFSLQYTRILINRMRFLVAGKLIKKLFQYFQYFWLTIPIS